MKIIKIYTDKQGNVIVWHRKNGLRKKDVVIFKPYYWIKENDVFKKVYYNYLDKWNISSEKTYELDLQSHQLYLIENELEFEDNYKILYFDIETKDTFGGIEIGRDRILSVCCVDNKGKEFIFCEDNEERMLRDFKELLLSYDLIIGYNSQKFDVPYLQSRFKLHNIYFDFRDINHVDLMIKIMGNYIIKNIISKSTIGARSYALNNIAKILIGEEKERIDARDEGYGGRIWQLFNEDRKKLISYNLQDSKLLKGIDEKYNIINTAIELSKLGKINIEETIWFSRIVDMIILRRSKKENLHYSTKKRDIEKVSYEGALTLLPEAGLYENIAMFDFVSLYANIVRAWNISIETLLPDNYEGECLITTNNIKFMTLNEKKGIIPTLFDELILRKTQLKKELKKLDTNDEKYIKKRLALDATKVVILTAYGVNGSAYSRYYNYEVANAITACGRYLLENIKKYLDKNGFEVCFGDTDSCAIKIKHFDNMNKVKKLIEEGLIEILKPFDINKKYFEMDFERFFDRLIIPFSGEKGAKKKYIGRVINDGQECDYIYQRGIELIKKDQCLLTKEFLNEIINQLLYKEINEEKCIEIIEKYKNRILKGKVNGDEIIIIKRIAKMFDEYKTVPVHVALAMKRKEQGERYYVSQQVPFIVIAASPLKIIHSTEFKDEFNREYYWTKQLFPPVQRILTAVFKKNDWEQYLDTSGQQKLFEDIK